MCNYLQLLINGLDHLIVAIHAVGIINLDFSKTFDVVPHEKLITKLGHRKRDL